MAANELPMKPIPRFRPALLVVLATAVWLPTAPGADFPLKVAESGRHLVGQKGEPFFVVGDTAWSLIAQLSEADIDHYLADRQRRGFNPIIVELIEHKFCTNVPNIEPCRTEYERRPVRPFVLIEAIYEGEHKSTPDLIRRQAYLTVLAGGCGQFFGNNPIWHFDGPGLFPSKQTWKEALDGTGSRDMARLRNLFSGLAWHRLEPEQEHEVVTAGYGEGTATTLTARTSDKRLAVTYIPSIGTASRKLTVNLGRFAGPVTVRWYNPLQSTHPRGLLVGFVDGSVQFITGTTNLAVLLRVAIRNDGQNVLPD